MNNDTECDKSSKLTDKEIMNEFFNRIGVSVRVNEKWFSGDTDDPAGGLMSKLGHVSINGYYGIQTDIQVNSTGELTKFKLTSFP